MARVTIDDLARRLGLSRASVSYALNGRPGVAEETRLRVTQLAMELGWQPSVSARSLSRSRADAYGIVLTREPEDLGSEPYYMGLLSGIESALSESGASLMIRFVPRDGDSEAAVYRQWSAERRVDGVILTDLRRDDLRPQLLDELALPYLVHGGRLTETGWQFDQAEDAAVLVEHLTELGHQRIAHLSGPADLLHEVERREAVVAIAARHRVEVITVEGDYGLDSAARLTAAMLRRRRPPTAIICSNDLMAVGAGQALRETGRSAAVLSWDESLLCRTASPGISALQRDPYGAGRSTARRLVDQVEARIAAQQVADHATDRAGNGARSARPGSVVSDAEDSAGEVSADEVSTDEVSTDEVSAEEGCCPEPDRRPSRLIVRESSVSRAEVATRA